jgi:hypothetical protein
VDGSLTLESEPPLGATLRGSVHHFIFFHSHKESSLVLTMPPPIIILNSFIPVNRMVLHI